MKVKQLPKEFFYSCNFSVVVKKLIRYNMSNAERVDAELRRPAFS